MTIKDQQEAYIEDFNLFDDWFQKYEYIIDLGRKLPAMDEKYKIPENVIHGCQSTVFLYAEFKDGKVCFSADSNSEITKGIVSIFVSVYSNHTPLEIISADNKFIETIGLQNYLTGQRSNGLAAMVKQIKMYAVAFQAKSLQP